MLRLICSPVGVVDRNTHLSLRASPGLSCTEYILRRASGCTLLAGSATNSLLPPGLPDSAHTLLLHQAGTTSNVLPDPLKPIHPAVNHGVADIPAVTTSVVTTHVITTSSWYRQPRLPHSLKPVHSAVDYGVAGTSVSNLPAVSCALERIPSKATVPPLPCYPKVE